MPSFLARMAGIYVAGAIGRGCMPSVSVEGESDLDVHAGGQEVEPLQRVDRLGRGLVDVDQALVRPDLEVLLGVLVLEGRADHRVDVLLGRQGHRAGDGRAGPRRGLHDLLGRGLDRRRVVRLETDADLVLGYGHVLSGAVSEILAGVVRAIRASPGLGARPEGSYRSTSAPRRGFLGPPRRTANYLMISVTTPEPTVRPPSRMAKRSPASMAMGWISSTSIWMLSPGMTISVPSGRLATPVTSVVRK